MNFSIPFSILVGCLAQGSLHAETFYLKKPIEVKENGKKKMKSVIVGKEQSRHKGKVEIKQVFDDGFVQYYKVEESNIDKITIEDLEAGFFKKVLELKKTPDLQDVEWYEKQIEEAITFYKKNFAKHPNIKEVEEVEKVILEEMKLIKEGGLKLNGKLIQPEDRKSSSYDIDSLIAAKKFHEFKKARKYGEAVGVAKGMNADFPKSKAYGSVVDEVPKMLKIYKSVLTRMEAERQRQLEVFNSLEEEQGEEVYNRVKIARENKYARVEAIIAKEKEAGKEWLTVNRDSEESIKHLLSLVEKELKPAEERAEAYVKDDLGSIYRKAWKAVERHDFDAAKKYIGELEAAEINESYLLSVSDFKDEVEGDVDIEKMIKARGGDGQRDMLEVYLEIDAKIQDTIFEAADYMTTAKDEKSAMSARNNLRSFKARVKRMLEKRAELEELETNDMEALNAEMAQQLHSLIRKFDAAKEVAAKNKDVFGEINVPATEFREIIPEPSEFLTDQSVLSMQKNLMMQEAEIKSLDVVVYESKFAEHKPEEPVLTEAEIDKYVYGESAESLEKLLKHCPTKLLVEYLNSVQHVFNSYKGNSYDKLTYDEQVIRNEEAKRKMDSLLNGKSLKDVIHKSREITAEKSWVTNLTLFKLKESPMGEVENLLKSIEEMEKAKKEMEKEMRMKALTNNKAKSIIGKNVEGLTYYLGAEGLTQKDFEKTPDYFLIYIGSAKSRKSRESVSTLVSYYNDVIADESSVELIMLSVESDTQTLHDWAVEARFPWPIVRRVDVQKSKLDKYAEKDLPFYHLIDKDGVSIAKGLDDVKAIIDAL